LCPSQRLGIRHPRSTRPRPPEPPALELCLQDPDLRPTRPRPPEPPALGCFEFRRSNHWMPSLSFTLAELFVHVLFFNRDLLSIIESYIGAISCEGSNTEDPCLERPADIYLHETPAERDDPFAPSRFSRCRMHVCMHGTPRGRVCYDHKQCRYWRNTSYVVDEGDSDESDSESCL
jgi:hypothetical protein